MWSCFHQQSLLVTVWGLQLPGSGFKSSFNPVPAEQSQARPLLGLGFLIGNEGGGGGGVVHLPGAYQEGQSEHVKGLAGCLPQGNISPDRKSGQARPNYRYPGVTFQPLVTLDKANEAWATHQREGLPGVSHMVSAPQAGSLPVLS